MTLLKSAQIPVDDDAVETNWAITQDRRGIMYFGNTAGVLEFDGASWRTIGLKNGSVARSLATDDTGTVFVGGQGDFGSLRPDQNGELRFVSLLGRIPLEDPKFTDVLESTADTGGSLFQRVRPALSSQ